MRTEWRERATQAYSLLIGGAGLAVLIYATVLDPPRIVLPAYFLFLLLSIIVKRTSIHVAHDVEHSLVGIVDIAAILIFGGVVGGWVAAISAAVLLDLRAVRRQQVNRQSLFVRPLFNAGLKALLSLLSAWVFVQLGGEIGAASLRASQWIPLGGMILVWFVVDHVAWGVAVWLRDGWAGLIEFFRTIWRYSLLVELAPLPFALFVALTYMVVGWGGFLFLSAILVVASWVLSRWSDATRQLELRVTEMETFGRVAQALANAPLDVGDLARLVHAFTQKLIDPPDFQLGLLNSDRHTFHLACWTVDRQMKEPDDVAITSAIEWLRRSQRTILVRDFEHADAPFSPARIGRLPRSEVLVPMIVKGEMTGFLSVQSPLPDEFDANDANALAAIAHQAAIAIENARLYEQEQQRANQLEAVAEAGRNLASILDLNELLSTVVRVIQERFGYYHVQVFVLDQNTHQAVFRASSSSELEALWRQCGREVSPGSIGIIAWVAKNGQALLANDVATEPLYTPDDPVLLPDTRAELAVPIRIEESVVGVLDVQSATQYAFSAEDEFVLTALSDELAVAIDAARMHMATREEAWISTVLLQAAESISRLENLEEVLAAIVRMTTLLAGVESCVIWLWSEDGASLDVAEAYGRGAEWRERVMQMSVAPADAPAFDQVRESQQRLLLDQDVPADIMPAEWRALLGEDQLLIMPLIGKGEVLGLMTVDCAMAGARMSERRVEMLVGIAHQAAVAIDGAQVYALQQVNAYVATVLLEVSRVRWRVAAT